MSTQVWLTFVSTVLILMSTPGPSHLLMLSNSLGNGFRRALATAAGDLSANIVQMTVAALGVVSLARASADIFSYIKWAGVSYLVYLGISLFRRRIDPAIAATRGGRSLRGLYWQGFMTSAANPKAIIFFAALFPQFVLTGSPAGPQFLLLGLTYLAIDATFLAFYGGFAAWIAARFQHYVGHHMNRLSGALLVVAAVLLGLRDVQ